MTADRLARYREKRDFSATAEPAGAVAARRASRTFVVQKHAARRLHYDLRLELDDVLLSWAVPKGPSLDPKDRRLAVQVEDHPVAYGTFEGRIPAGEYGAGDVIVWDRGHWEPIGDPHRGLREGKLGFRLEGEKLGGAWELIRIARTAGERQPSWLLLKKRDERARAQADFDVTRELPDSVLASTGRPAGTALLSAAARDALLAGGARTARLPTRMQPQLATLVAAPPTEGDWIHEIKFDGYRILARVDGDDVRLLTRAGNDWTAKMQPLAADIARLGLSSAWIDGEVVVLDPDGAPSFNALQNAFDAARAGDIVYYAFDLPCLDGLDLRGVPLVHRRAALESLLADRALPHLRFSADFDADPATVLASACGLQLEGVIAKRRDSRYAGVRNDDWIKLKCTARQEFVVGGFVARKDDAAAIGALLLGVHDDSGRLIPVGSVGTGWSRATAKDLQARLARLERRTSPFARALQGSARWPRSATGTIRWVAPRLVAEVRFSQWTPDGNIRHASFQGLREDKDPAAVVREAPAPPAAKPAAEPVAPEPGAARPPPARRATGRAHRTEPTVAGLQITHADRVVDPSSGATKLALVRYYAQVGERMLPHLKGRPVAFLRAPDGIGGPHFFQKHPDARVPGLTLLDPALWPGHRGLMAIDSVAALVAAAQMNVVEFHTWNGRHADFEAPDRMIFDLDPGEGTPWSAVVEAAALVRALLEELGLAAFLKTSGGKGLHVAVPLKRRDDWDTVKAFSRHLVLHLARTFPDRIVAKSGPANRVGRLFVDYLRNGFGATTVAAFSARARPGLGVSVPLPWAALDTLERSDRWTIATLADDPSLRREDPWRGWARAARTLGPAMKRIGFP